jgi:glyoxylase-like metal-dependent hydrolase (beta-lactamase superfamily II)
MGSQKTRVWLNPPHCSGELAERPEGFVGPNLDPKGLELQPQELGPGVYALMANQPPKDYNGLIVGSRAALVVDAGISGTVARQIQDIVAQKTDRPLSYLVNTTYHGDHTFGNYAFPPKSRSFLRSKTGRAWVTWNGKSATDPRASGETWPPSRT